MKTPFGRECKFFYGDYYRGRNVEECRAVPVEQKNKWVPNLCKNCPVPKILINNACPNLSISAEITKPLIGKARVGVKAWCLKIHDKVKDPDQGCPVCHAHLAL